MVCTICGLSYGGTQHKGDTWYRCGGKRRERGATEGICPGRRIKGDHIEPLVWQDVERYLRHPGDLLDELDADHELDTAATVRERELHAIEAALAELDEQRRRAQNLAVRGAMRDDELDAELARIAGDRAAVEPHRATLAPPPVVDEPMDGDLLDRLRRRLDEGLSDEERHEIVRLLVGRITIATVINDDGTKDATATLSFRFPGTLETRTGMGSSRRRPPDLRQSRSLLLESLLGAMLRDQSRRRSRPPLAAPPPRPA